MTRLFLFLWLFLVVAHSLIGQSNGAFKFPEGITSQDYAPHIVVVKIAEDKDQPNQRTLSPGVKTEKIKKLIGAKKINQLFPDIEEPGQSGARKPAPREDISNIFKIFLNEGEDVAEAINLLLTQPEIIYAEPYYNIRPLHVPNDPDAQENGFQDHLKLIKAYDAWAITKGDTNVIIGVLDTGYDHEHEDLKGNIKHNHKDPINNFDDDDDGYKDNFAGWDFANSDNKPYSDRNGHGTEVTGVCAASNNNGKGIAGTGYNSKFMPIKIYKTDDDSFSFGYEAIVYAANKGCKVINLSWGDYRGGYSNFVQDIINYAVLEKDVVIVAAAGNTNDQLNFYPASYNNVLSVGATDMNDNKTTWGTYSYHIDLMAPGQAVYTTKNTGQYGYSQGSSFSSPMVAGAAALVRAQFPNLNALQVIERMRVTADDIYHLPYNQAFQDKLGNGRLNMHRAVSDYSSPAIRMNSVVYKNRFGTYAFPGDTVDIIGTFTNYLTPSSNATVSISSSSPYVTILQGIFNIGILGTLSKTQNINQSFKIIIKADTPPGTLIPLRLVYEDGLYKDFQVFEFETTPDFLTLNNGSVGLTLSGNGNLGYHTDEYMYGSGFTYQNKRILDIMGFMVSTDPTKVYNNVIHRFDNKKRNNDFASVSPIRLYDNGLSHLEARSHFIDKSADLPNQNLKIDQKLLSFKGLPDNDFLILEYRILNNSGADIAKMHSGIYADWNINNKLRNIVQWDASLNLSYVTDPNQPDLFAGIALLTPQQAGAYALSNISNTTGDIAEDFIFTREEKYDILTSGITNAQSPQGSAGNEASHVLSASISNLSHKNHVKVAYALVVGSSLEKLKKNTEAAKKKYEEHSNSPPLIFSTFICEGQSASIDPKEGNIYNFYKDLALTDLLHTGSSFTTGAIEEDTVFYLENIDMGYSGDVLQAKVLINKNVTDFSMDPETLILVDGGDNWVQFNDYNENSVRWDWNFGNGYGSTVKNPKTRFFSSGTYNVKLIVENSSGCKNTIYKKIVVKKQSPEPIFENVQICQGIIPVIVAENSSKIKVYKNAEATDPIFEGPVFEPENLTSDTSFFISNAEFDVDSPKKELRISVSPHKAHFELLPYNDNLNNKALFIAKNLSINSTHREWYINDVFISQEIDLIIDINMYQDINIMLKSKNPDACEDQVTVFYTKRKSDTPTIGKVISCNGTDAVIAPTNGHNFYFYGDKSLSDLLFKGKAFATTSHERIFVTGIDNFIESEPVEVVIDYQIFHPDFNFHPEILNLSSSQQVSFIDSGDGVLSWNWDFGNGQTQHIQNPTQVYDEPGEYWITLTAENQNGCIESISKKLLVVNITSVGENGVERPAINVFPNPTHKSFFISFSHHKNQIINIKVLDQLNRAVFFKTLSFIGDPLEIDVSQYSSGIYHLQVETSDNILYKKIMIER